MNNEFNSKIKKINEKKNARKYKYPKEIEYDDELDYFKKGLFKY